MKSPEIIKINHIENEIKITEGTRVFIHKQCKRKERTLRNVNSMSIDKATTDFLQNILALDAATFKQDSLPVYDVVL